MELKNHFNYLLILFIFTILGSSIFPQYKQYPETRPLFVLLTDFGYDFAVGSIKGVIIKKLPSANIIDLDHSIKKYNITSAGFVLAKSYKYFPTGTIFICVIDPGVGTKREAICVKTPNYSFLGPNNGIFDFVLEQEKNQIIYQIDESYIKSGANTFHGRDLFAPAAADFYKGNLENFTIFDKNRLVHIPVNSNIIATYIDSFGNIKTNKSTDSLIPAKSVLIVNTNNNEHKIPFVKTFKDVKVGQLLCYAGSNNTLEIAINQGSAAALLGINVGDALVGQIKN